MKRLVFGGLFLAFVAWLWLAAAIDDRLDRIFARRRASSPPLDLDPDFNPWEDL